MQEEAFYDEMARTGELLPTDDVLQLVAEFPGPVEAAAMAFVSVAATGLVGFLVAGTAATLAHVLAARFGSLQKAA